MNKEELAFIKELKLDDSVYGYADDELGLVRLMIIYRGDRLFFQLNERALICIISARDSMLRKKSIKKWDDGHSIAPQEKDEILKIIEKYYEQSYKDKLIII